MISGETVDPMIDPMSPPMILGMVVDDVRS